MVTHQDLPDSLGEGMGAGAGAGAGVNKYIDISPGISQLLPASLISRTELEGGELSILQSTSQCTRKSTENSDGGSEETNGRYPSLPFMLQKAKLWAGGDAAQWQRLAWLCKSPGLGLPALGVLGHVRAREGGMGTRRCQSP